MVATQELEEQQLRWRQIETLCGHRIDMSLMSPYTSEPATENRALSSSSLEQHTRWLLPTGGDSSSSPSLSLYRKGSTSEVDMPMIHTASAPGNITSLSKMRSHSASESSNGIVMKKKVIGEKKGFIGTSVSEENEHQLHGSISGGSSCASLSTGLFPAVSARSESPPAVKKLQGNHKRVSLGKIGKQLSDPSVTVSEQGSDETDLPGSSFDPRNFYRNKSDYAKDYNSLACASIPRVKEEPVRTKASKTLDDLKQSTENVSDSEMVTKDGKKKRKRFWHKVL
jgi:uncharacterized protein YjgD (DUF1641 family)